MLPVLLLNTQTFHSWLKLNTRYIQPPCKNLGASPNAPLCQMTTQLSGCLLSSNMLLCPSLSQSCLPVWSLEMRISPGFLFSLPPTGLRNHLNIASAGQIFGQNLPCPCKTGKCQCPHFKGRALRFFQDLPKVEHLFRALRELRNIFR